MDLSDDSSRGSSSKSSRSKSQSGSEKSAKSNNSKSKSCTVTSEQIEQFCAVTGSTKDVARTLIEACRGNLERAVDMHMEGMSENPNTSSAQDEDYVRAPIPQKQEVLVEAGYEGYGFGFKGKRRIVKSVFDSFRNFEVETKLQESRLRETNGASASAAGSSTASSKRTLEDLFRPPIDMTFNGNLQTARDTGKSLKKWIMVNVQNVSEFSCQCLNRDVWSQKRIKELVKENFLFLQVYMDSEEGQRYMTFYKINQWPYVAVLDPRTGELMVEWNYSDCSTYETLINEFLATSSWGDEDKGSNPSEPKKRKLETILDASEDDQIQAAIRASLVENRKVPASCSDSGSDDEDEPADWFDSESDSRASEPRKAEDAVEKKPELKPIEDRLEATKIEDDWQRHLGPETDPTSSIVIRFPDGSKEQKTLPCSSTLMAVIKYAASKGFPRDKFELMANFPKRLLLSMDSEMTLKDAGLFPHETIFVQAR